MCSYPVSFDVKVWSTDPGTGQDINVPVGSGSSGSGFTVISMCYGDELEIPTLMPPSCSVVWFIRKENNLTTQPVLSASSSPANNYLLASGSQQTLLTGVWYERWNNQHHIVQPNNPVHDNYFLSDLDPGIYWLAVSFNPINLSDPITYIQVEIKVPLESPSVTACKNEEVTVDLQGCGLDYYTYFPANTWNAGISWSSGQTGASVVFNGSSSISGTVNLQYEAPNRSSNFNSVFNSANGSLSYSVPFQVTFNGPDLPTLATALDNCVASQNVQIGNYNSSYFYSASLDINGTVYTGSPVLDVSSMNTNGQITLNYPAAASGSVTLSITATQNGAGAPFPCSQTASFSTSLDCCFQPGVATISNSSASQVFGTSTIVNNAIYVINGNFVVDQDLDLRNCHLYFGKDAQMIVQSGKTLRLRNGSILEAC